MTRKEQFIRGMKLFWHSITLPVWSFSGWIFCFLIYMSILRGIVTLIDYLVGIK